MPPVGHDSAMGMSLPTGNTGLGMWQGKEGEGLGTGILWDKDRVSVSITLGGGHWYCHQPRSEEKAEGQRAQKLSLLQNSFPN